MSNKALKNILLLATAVICQFAMAFGVMFFYQNALMSFPLGIRMVLMFITQWIFFLYLFL